MSQDQVESLAGNCYEVYSEEKKLHNYLQTIHVMCIFKKNVLQKISIKKCIIIEVVLNCPFSSLNSHFCPRICRECLVEKKNHSLFAQR